MFIGLSGALCVYRFKSWGLWIFKGHRWNGNFVHTKLRTYRPMRLNHLSLSYWHLKWQRKEKKYPKFRLVIYISTKYMTIILVPKYPLPVFQFIITCHSLTIFDKKSCMIVEVDPRLGPMPSVLWEVPIYRRTTLLYNAI